MNFFCVPLVRVVNMLFAPQFLLWGFLIIWRLTVILFIGRSLYMTIVKQKSGINHTTQLAVISMLAALAAGLMFIEFPLPFIAPSFYEFDFSEVPVLVGTYSMGPVAGVIIELVKILVKFLIKGTSTGGLIYKHKKSRKSALIGMLTGTITMAVVGILFNTFVLVPLYSNFMPIEAIISLGKEIVPFISDTFTFCIFCVGPFNIVKGLIISLIVFFIYKPLSNLIRSIDKMFMKK